MSNERGGNYKAPPPPEIEVYGEMRDGVEYRVEYNPADGSYKSTPMQPPQERESAPRMTAPPIGGRGMGMASPLQPSQSQEREYNPPTPYPMREGMSGKGAPYYTAPLGHAPRNVPFMSGLTYQNSGQNQNMPRSDQYPMPTGTTGTTGKEGSAHPDGFGEPMPKSGPTMGSAPATTQGSGGGSTGTASGQQFNFDPKNPADALWWNQFRQEHQGLDPITFFSQPNNWKGNTAPSEQQALQWALADRYWGDALFRDRGFAPTFGDWMQKHGNEQQAGRPIAPYTGMANQYRGGGGDLGANKSGEVGRAPAVAQGAGWWDAFGMDAIVAQIFNKAVA